MSRDLSIDAARGLALLLVVFSHAIQLPALFTVFYIACFFFISGMLYRPERVFKENVSKKFRRVIVPYFINSLVLLGFYFFATNTTIGFLKHELFGILYSRYAITQGGTPLLDALGNSPLWFLTSFFCTSILFHAIVDRVIINRRLFICSIVLLLAASVILTRVSDYILLPWSLDMTPFFCAIMLAGYAFQKNRDSISLDWMVLLSLGTLYVSLSFCGLEGMNLSIGQYGRGGVLSAYMSGICGTIICLWICEKIKGFCANVLRLIGTNTIVILAYHMTFIRLCRIIFEKNIPNIPICIRDIIVVLLTLSICVAIGEYYAVLQRKVSNINGKRE